LGRAELASRSPDHAPGLDTKTWKCGARRRLRGVGARMLRGPDPKAQCGSDERAAQVHRTARVAPGRLARCRRRSGLQWLRVEGSDEVRPELPGEPCTRTGRPERRGGGDGGYFGLPRLHGDRSLPRGAHLVVRIARLRGGRLATLMWSTPSNVLEEYVAAPVTDPGSPCPPVREQPGDLREPIRKTLGHAAARCAHRDVRRIGGRGIQRRGAVCRGQRPECAVHRRRRSGLPGAESVLDSAVGRPGALTS